MQAAELLRRLEKGPACVFGGGYVAEGFWQALDLHGLSGALRACLVSAPAPGQRFHGLPVLAPRDIGPGEAGLVCLAVHESLAAGLEGALRAQGFDEIVPVAPLMPELLYGPPLQSCVPLARGALLAAQEEDAYWLAVRCAAIRAHLRGEDSAYPDALYRRALALHCGEATAGARLCALKALADSMAAHGFDAAHPLLIDEDFRVIDGLHRLAAACVLGIDTLPCTIYPVSPMYDRLLGEKNRLPAHLLTAAGFTENDMAFLRQLRQELSGSPQRSFHG